MTKQSASSKMAGGSDHMLLGQILFCIYKSTKGHACWGALLVHQHIPYRTESQGCLRGAPARSVKSTGCLRGAC